MADHETQQRSGGPRLAVVVSHHGPLAVACARDLAAADPGLTVVVVGDGATDGSTTLAEVVDAHGPVSVLVTVPRLGIPGRSSIPGPDEPEVDEVATASEAVRAVAPAMVAAGDGRIVLVSEVTGIPGRTWDDGSGTAMWGLVGLARSAARDLAVSGVTVNVVRAGVVATPELERAQGDDPAVSTAVEEAVAATPLRRMASLDDIAAAVTYLASPEASYVTGLVLPVDGGLAMGLGN